MIAVPLRATDRRVIGVLEISAAAPHWVTPTRRQVILGVAEQSGLALERAQLQSDAVRAATASAFIAHLADVLERSTTVSSRVRRLTELLTDERATFAAVHLLEDGKPRLAAISGSRPAETGDDDEWLSYVEESIATGRPVHPQESPEGGDSGPVPSPLAILPLRARGKVSEP